MNVFMGRQAEMMSNSQHYPEGSIGLFNCSDGWFYWYSDRYMFDCGVESSEEDAFNKAKQNLIRYGKI